jgi:D-cysteine desulfhydrase family pyridoxal phosphate-dependent enzyme
MASVDPERPQTKKRFPLANLPTPIEELPHLTAFLGGPRLLVKRDDQTGLAFGGNKARKLEFLIADAIAREADTIITAGAAQSNHCRQTAAAARRANLRCVLVLGGEEPVLPNGNLLLDQLLGAEIHWTGMERRGERMHEIAAALREKGRTPYLIPYGGSNGVGAQGYVEAMRELVRQLAEMGETIDVVVFASSSGGTQAGIVLGAKLTGFGGEILGISIDKGERGPDRFEVELATIANDAAREMGAEVKVVESEFGVCYDYLGAGYGVVGDLEREAIHLAAYHEGLMLDPVYTGRAFGAMIDLIRKGRFAREANVLFWHTGGGPALFAYAADVLGR